MKVMIAAFLSVGLLVPLTYAQTTAAPAPAAASTNSPSSTLKDKKDKVSYSLGINIGHGLKKSGIDINNDQLLAGLKDAITGGKTLLTDEEVRATLTALQEEMQAKQMAQEQEEQKALAKKNEVEGKKNQTDGEAFLAANKGKEGVVTLPSGLQYKIVTAGTGPKPKANSTVKTHYRGTLIDGTEFDSSYKRGEPVTFPVDGVIPGWTEALQLMPVGSKWQLFIPSKLGYGERGAGAAIGPNATLIFDVELLAIEK